MPKSQPTGIDARLEPEARNVAARSKYELQRRHYVQGPKAHPRRWTTLSPNQIEKYRSQSADFCIVVIGDRDDPTDFYAIPYKEIAHHLVGENLFTQTDKKTGRVSKVWAFHLHGDQFQFERDPILYPEEKYGRPQFPASPWHRNLALLGLAIVDPDAKANKNPTTQRSGRPRPDENVAATTAGKPLREREDDDLAVLVAANTVVQRRLHNTMTNALRALVARAGLTLEEGGSTDCLFDALLLNYAVNARDLLIEVKTSSEPPFCRMAVGQLLDYRRDLPNQACTDLAALFPERPSDRALTYLGSLGIKVLWFVDEMTRINGDLTL